MDEVCNGIHVKVILCIGRRIEDVGIIPIWDGVVVKGHVRNAVLCINNPLYDINNDVMD